MNQQVKPDPGSASSFQETQSHLSAFRQALQISPGICPSVREAMLKQHLENLRGIAWRELRADFLAAAAIGDSLALNVMISGVPHDSWMNETILRAGRMAVLHEQPESVRFFAAFAQAREPGATGFLSYALTHARAHLHRVPVEFVRVVIAEAQRVLAPAVTPIREAMSTQLLRRSAQDTFDLSVAEGASDLIGCFSPHGMKPSMEAVLTAVHDEHHDTLLQLQAHSLIDPAEVQKRLTASGYSERRQVQSDRPAFRM